MAVEVWQQAEQEAAEAEARLKQAWNDYYQQKAKAPSTVLRAEVSRLRDVAAGKLEAAVKLSHRDAKPSKPGEL